MQPDWEIWLDNHLSPIIAKWLNERSGFIVKSVYTLELYSLSDRQIYLKARKSGNVILISKDSPPKLISHKIGKCDNKKLFTILERNMERSIRLLLDFNKDIIEIT